MPLLKFSLACRFGFLECIWNSCIFLFSLGRGERHDAYSILSLYFSTLKSGHQSSIFGVDIVQDFDLRNVSEYWDELRRGLVSLSTPRHFFKLLTLKFGIPARKLLVNGMLQ